MITAHNARSTRRRGSSSSGKNEPVTQLRDADFDIAGRGRQQLRAMPIAQRRPLRGALARGGADRRGELGFDQLLQGGGEDVA